MENPVRATTLEVVKKAKDVKINQARIEELAEKWAKGILNIPAWSEESHLQTNDEQAALDYIILLTSINFCFWASKQKARWQIEYEGKKYNGYFALSLALKSFFEKNPAKGNLDFFSKITFKQFKEILKGGQNLLLLKERWNIVKAVSSKIIKKYKNSVSFFSSANKQASILVEKAYKELPFFNDTSRYDGKRVYLLKRPQILAADAWGMFGGKGFGEFEDMDYLTCFPDYKVPQALEYFGIIEYSKDLSKKIKNKILIPHNSKQEIEIRAATIWGVEYLKEALAKKGKELRSFEVDWILWNKAQNEKIEKPYHLSKTVYY